MPRRSSTTPSEAELEVLRVIWQRGRPSTLRDVQESLPGEPNRGSVFARLESLVEKGYLAVSHRSKGEGGTVYVATESRDGVFGRILKRLAPLLGGESPAALIIGLLRSGELDPREARRLRAMLKREGRNRGSRPDSRRGKTDEPATNDDR